MSFNIGLGEGATNASDPPKEQIKSLKRSIVVLNEALAHKTSEL